MGSSQSKASKTGYKKSNNKGRRGFDEDSSVFAAALASERDRPDSIALSSSSSFLNHPIYLPPGPRDMHLAPPAKRLAKKVKKRRSRQLQPLAQAQQHQARQHWPLIASDQHYTYQQQQQQQENLLYANGVTYVNEGAAAGANGNGIGHGRIAASQALAAAASNKKKQRRSLQQQQQHQLQQRRQMLYYNNHLPPMDSAPPPPLQMLRDPMQAPLPLDLLQTTQELELEQSPYSSPSPSPSPPPLPPPPLPLNEVRAFRAFESASRQVEHIPPPPDQFYSAPSNATKLASKPRETKSTSKAAAAAKKQQHKMQQQMSSQTDQQQARLQQQQQQAAAGNQTERGLALSYDERRRHGKLGLLPAAVQDQELQIKVVVNFIDQCKDELCKYVYLRNLKDFNENLFYASLSRHVEKLMPIVYTPTVGLACQKFSEIYMRPRGLFISANEAGQVAEVLANWPRRDVLVIVVTDGERILGLGDLGANGMGISIGKLSLYTALAGIPPQNVLPITIDVGTNNETYLKDPLYIGLRQERLRGAKYDELIDEFMRAVVDRFGRTCLIQFEDFANSNAFGLLQRYRNHYCTFNDDIQGTASVCLSGLISAARLIGRRMADCSFLFYGAGEANLGTAQLLVMAMLEEGASKEEASSRIWLVDSKGLVVKSRTDLSGHKRAFAQEAPHLRDLEEIIDYTKPHGIVGASAQGGAFNESICKKMAHFNERPIIFALSNPTSKAECTADQAYRWTEGRCVFASGSPFEPVNYNGRTYVTGQGNNAYIFPAVGLACIAARIYTIPEDTFLVAARALSDQLTPADTTQGLVYPSLSKIRDVTLRVATRVLEHFYSERLATYRPEPNDKLAYLKGIQYDYNYR